MIKTPFIHICIIVAFLANMLGPIPWAKADELRLPVPGVRVPLSPPLNPPILKGIKVYPDNPFRFDFILDKGDSGLSVETPLMASLLKQEAAKLIKYFLASLTIPEDDLWVNLSPYEKNRIIPQSFGKTEMGRDLLAEDYMLKQITASLIYPEGETGKKFWKRIYQEAQKKYGTTNIPVNTFNKVWIIPEKAVVYENAKAKSAYVVESKLKVMLEQDYLALSKNTVVLSAAKDLKMPLDSLSTSQNDVNALGSKIVREIVIPELTKEVNENKNFAQLRQVYNSLILATWYKRKIKDSILEQVYADKKKVSGVGYDQSIIPALPTRGHVQDRTTKNVSPSTNDVEAIYQRYLQAFKKGVYNYIKEDIDPATQETFPRKYFSGGTSLKMAGVENVVFDPGQLPPEDNFSKAMVVRVRIRDAMEAVKVVINTTITATKRVARKFVKTAQPKNILHSADHGAVIGIARGIYKDFASQVSFLEEGRDKATTASGQQIKKWADIEQQFYPMLLNVLQQIPGVDPNDLTTMSPEQWRLLRGLFKRSIVDIVPDRQQEAGRFLYYIDVFMTRDEMEGYAKKLGARDVANVLERLHTLSEDFLSSGLREEIFGNTYHLNMLMEQEPFSSLSYLRFLEEAGLAGNAWDARPINRMAMSLLESRNYKEFQDLFASRDPSRRLSLIKTAAEYFKIDIPGDYRKHLMVLVKGQYKNMKHDLIVSSLPFDIVSEFNFILRASAQIQEDEQTKDAHFVKMFSRGVDGIALLVELKSGKKAVVKINIIDANDPVRMAYPERLKRLSGVSGSNPYLAHQYKILPPIPDESEAKVIFVEVNEFIDGPSLRTQLDERWQSADANSIFNAIGQYARLNNNLLAGGFVNGDLRNMGNIVVDPEDQLRLVDFGNIQDYNSVDAIKFKKLMIAVVVRMLTNQVFNTMEGSEPWHMAQELLKSKFAGNLKVLGVFDFLSSAYLRADVNYRQFLIVLGDLATLAPALRADSSGFFGEFEKSLADAQNGAKLTLLKKKQGLVGGRLTVGERRAMEQEILGNMDSPITVRELVGIFYERGYTYVTENMVRGDFRKNSHPMLSIEKVDLKKIATRRAMERKILKRIKIPITPSDLADRLNKRGFKGVKEWMVRDDFSGENHPMLIIQRVARKSVEARRVMELEILNDSNLRKPITVTQLHGLLKKKSGYSGVKLETVYNDVASDKRLKGPGKLKKGEDDKGPVVSAEHSVIGILQQAGLARNDVQAYFSRTEKSDKAHLSHQGGIDLTPANMNVQTRTGFSSTDENGTGIKFHLDPAQLAQLQNAPGFVPVIISVTPLASLRGFLGAVNNDLPQLSASV